MLGRTITISPRSGGSQILAVQEYDESMSVVITQPDFTMDLQ